MEISSSVATGADFTADLYLLNSRKGNERMNGKKAERMKVDLSAALSILNGSLSWHKLRLIHSINGNIDAYAEIWETFLTPGNQTEMIFDIEMNQNPAESAGCWTGGTEMKI